jgi:hypothetical protein
MPRARPAAGQKEQRTPESDEHQALVLSGWSLAEATSIAVNGGFSAEEPISLTANPNCLSFPPMRRAAHCHEPLPGGDCRRPHFTVTHSAGGRRERGDILIPLRPSDRH